MSFEGKTFEAENDRVGNNSTHPSSEFLPNEEETSMCSPTETGLMKEGKKILSPGKSFLRGNEDFPGLACASRDM